MDLSITTSAAAVGTGAFVITRLLRRKLPKDSLPFVSVGLAFALAFSSLALAANGLPEFSAVAKLGGAASALALLGRTLLKPALSRVLMPVFGKVPTAWLINALFGASRKPENAKELIDAGKTIASLASEVKAKENEESEEKPGDEKEEEKKENDSNNKSETKASSDKSTETSDEDEDEDDSPAIVISDLSKKDSKEDSKEE